MIHTVMFTALVQAAMDEQWIEVPNLGTEKKTKLFPKLGPYWMSFANLYLDVDEDGLSDEETELDEDIEGMQFDNSNNGSDEEEDERCASLLRERIQKHASDKPEEREPNPVRKLVVNAILDALRIVKESGSSCQTFEDILNHG